MLEVIQPGLYSTVQDQGRFGYRAYGVPLSGAMDQRALACANWLCGNRMSAAVLEMTVLGARFLVQRDCVIAITGADMQAVCGGRPLPNWQSHACRAGEELVFQYAAKGCRTYLAIAGGIDVPLVMNSRSTYARGRFGGVDGGLLKRGACLQGGAERDGQAQGGLPEWFGLAEAGSNKTIRVLPGVQCDAFAQDALVRLCRAPYEVSADSDRMGYRLIGDCVPPSVQADIISDALIPGSIQVPGNGLPIVMLADCQTTGGYTKIAQVIQPDLDHLAQVQPGELIQFELVTEAQALVIRQAYRRQLEQLFLPAETKPRRLLISIDNQEYHVVVEEE